MAQVTTKKRKKKVKKEKVVKTPDDTWTFICQTEEAWEYAND